MYRSLRNRCFSTRALNALVATVLVTGTVTTPLRAQELSTKDLLPPAHSASTTNTDTTRLNNDAQLEAAERALLEGLATTGTQKKDPSPPQAVEGRAKDDSQVRLVSFDKKERLDTFDGALPDPRLETKPLPQAPLAGDAPSTLTSDTATDDVAHLKPASQESAKVVTQNPNAALKRELETSQKRVSELERQLEEVRGQLTMAETELSRLSSIAEARSRANLGLPTLQESPRAMAKSVPAALPKEPQAEAMPSSADLEIVTVAVEKADLRLGPGKAHSPLMSVARGARLAVEVRQGEWLRVFAPNGQRAWVYAGSVTFGNRTGTGKASSAVKVRGYSSSLEDEAFKRVQSITSGY